MEPTDTDPITKLQRDLGFDVNEHESDHSVYHRSSLSLDEFEKESENEISQSKSESLSNTHIKNKPRGVSKSVIAVAVDKEIQTQPMQEPSLASPVTSSKQSKTILPPGSTNKIHSISKSAGALQKQTSNGKSDQNIKTTVTSAESPSESVDLVQSKKNLNLKTQNTDSMTKNSNNNQNLQSTIQEEIRKQIASLGNSVNPTVEAYANPQLRMTTSVQKPEIAEYQSVSGPGTNEPSESESPHHLMKVLSELNDLVGSPSQSELRERRLKKKEAEIQRRERKLKQEGIVMKRLLLKGKRMMQDLIETHEHQSKQFGNHQSRSTSQSNKNHILWPQQNQTQSQSQNQMMQNFNQGQNQNQNSNTYHGTQAGNEYTSPNPSWFTPERVEGSLADQQVNSISNSAALIQTTSDKSKTSDSESSVKTAAVSSEGISRNKTLNWFRRFIGKLYKSR